MNSSHRRRFTCQPNKLESKLYYLNYHQVVSYLVLVWLSVVSKSLSKFIEGLFCKILVADHNSAIIFAFYLTDMAVVLTRLRITSWDNHLTQSDRNYEIIVSFSKQWPSRDKQRPISAAIGLNKSIKCPTKLHYYVFQGPISLTIFPSQFKCDGNFILLSFKY